MLGLHPAVLCPFAIGWVAARQRILRKAGASHLPGAAQNLSIPSQIVRNIQ